MGSRLPLKTAVLISFAALTAACSIDYGSSRIDTSQAPDFIFTDTTLTRVQNGSPRAIMESESIEQYGSEQCLYGRNLSFRLLTAKGDTSTVGSCGLFSMDQQLQQYTFLDSVQITSFEQDVIITAANLHWDNTTEQMSSDRIHPVTITTGTTGREQNTVTTITGTGLRVDGITRTFTFEGAIDGMVISSTEESE